MISPKTPSREALLDVLTGLLARVRREEVGIIKSGDAEFLHRYRVSLRKTRALLSLLKGVFPDAQTLEWKEKLAAFSRATNALRDLDVYFLSRQKFEDFLPKVLQSGLEVFLRDLAKTRRREASKVSSFLKSAKYGAELSRLETEWHEALTLEASVASGFPISGVAGKAIAKCFRRIRKIYSQFHNQSSDARLHAIRIECKKMRYLLECFGKLFSDHGVERLTRRLAKLQNHLGRYNDISIQKAHFLEVAKKHLHNGDARLHLTLGCLIGGLHHEHADLKKKVLDALKDFCSPKNGKLAKNFWN